MHISNGKFEGIEIKDSPKRGIFSTRELTVKEELFDIIGSRINKAEILDINDFNGIYGIEALSRGAKEVYFIGEDIDSYQIVETNLKKVNVDESVLVKEDPLEFFKDLNENKKFKVIFFEVQSQSDNGLEKELIKHLTDDGVLFMIIPIFGGTFKIPKKIAGGCIQETRDAEQRIVLVVTKNSELNERLPKKN